MARKKKTEAPRSQISLSKKWLGKIESAKKSRKIEKAFERMKADMKFARMCQEDENDNEYKANFVLRHLNNKTATLYAKNPKIVAERRQKMLFTVWDGDIQAIMEAKEAVAALQQPLVDPMTGMPGVPAAMTDPQAASAMAQAQAVLADYEQGKQKAAILEKVGKTLSMLMEYFLDECNPRFKVAGKQAVRRAITTGIAWLKVGFQRTMGKSPDIESRLDDVQMQLAYLRERLQEQNDREGWDKDSAKAAELEAMLKSLQDNPDVVLREGLVFSWPKSTRIIPDPETTSIVGFTGTNWIAEEYLFSKEQVEAIFGVELESGKFTEYGEDGKQLVQRTKWSEKGGEGDCDSIYALVYEVWDKTSGLCMTVCDGYEGFLKEPAAPDVRLERFYPYFPLMFNGIEDDEEIYPPSDIRLMMPMQLEYNRARHGLREHRKANRPGLACAAGKLEQTDKENLALRPANCVIELVGLAPDQPVANVLQAIPNAPLDPNLYDVSYVFDDTQRVVGVAEANIGGTSGSTATESSIAESTRQTGVGSNVNDMDEWLSDFAQAAGQILLMNMGQEQVRQIVGDGAAWPELTAEDIAKEVWLSVEAGSSGKPNKALETSNWERMLPFILQMPGVNPKMLLKETLYRSDDRLDVEDFFTGETPSIAAQNSQTPNGQDGALAGPQGAQNAPQPQGRGGNPNMSKPAQGQAQ